MAGRGDRDREEAPLEDSEIDFDDESSDDQSPLDTTEASELGIELDEPDGLSERDDFDDEDDFYDEDEFDEEDELPDDEDDEDELSDDEL